mmetsp:Transcript_82612/g.130153  ORF Transcript_82612/g.130153 Transcript_82612/m.130153 type:complete len:380 (-) Transcript_82612:39-1178(-)
MGQHHPTGCCGSKCGQPTIVSIGDDVCPPKKPAAPDRDPGLGGSDALPGWLSELAPSLIGEEAERAADAWVRCGEELRRRTRQFVRRAMCGVPCWFIDQAVRRTVPASYIIDDKLETFLIETAGPPEASARHVTRECKVADMRNVWVCADSELARRVHSTLINTSDTDSSCVLLIDAPSEPLGLVERSSEAREEFLDCMAVLVAAQRLRCEPEVARCRRIGGLPPPEARLRPFGKSLHSVHVSGPICSWLAQAAADLLPYDEYHQAMHEASVHLSDATSSDEIDARCERSSARGPGNAVLPCHVIGGGRTKAAAVKHGGSRKQSSGNRGTAEFSAEERGSYPPFWQTPASSDDLPTMLGDWVADQSQSMIPMHVGVSSI